MGPVPMLFKNAIIHMRFVTTVNCKYLQKHSESNQFLKLSVFIQLWLGVPLPISFRPQFQLKIIDIISE